MKAGFAKAVVTPPVGFSLVGYFHDRRSTGIRDDLYVNAAVLDDGSEVFVIITADMIWFDSLMVDRIREKINSELGISGPNILVHATHTHTGPLTENETGGVYSRGFYVEPSYIELLVPHIAGCVRMAYTDREDVSLGSAVTEVSSVAFNRRYLMKDGMIVTNPWDRQHDIVESAGVADNSLAVIKVTDLGHNNIKGLIVNFGLHPDTMGDELISADWPGLLREKISKEYPGAEAIVLNGPSGDINHIDPSDPGRRGPEVPNHIASVLMQGIRDVLPRIETREGLQLKVFSKKVEIPYKGTSREELLTAADVLSKDLPKDSLQYMVYSKIQKIAEEKRSNTRIKAEINGAGIGKETLLMGLPGEIFTGISLKIKDAAPFNNVLIAQNCNMHLGYLPSKEAFAQHEKNFEISPGYSEKSLSESFGINCSYETTPLACSVNGQAEGVILKAVDSLFEPEDTI